MAQQSNSEKEIKPIESAQQTSELPTVGENLDLKGGRVLDAPDFVELALQGFSEGELKQILRLRRRYNETDENEVTPEFKRLRFARFLYNEGKIEG